MVVRHVHGRDAELPQQDLQVHAVFLAQRLVQVGEGLVHQEERRVARDAAAERDALLLAARQRGGLAIQQVGQLDAHQLAGPLVLRAGEGVQLRRLLAEQEVGQHVGARAHVRIERVALEDHADAPITGANVAHVHVVVADHARVGGDEAGDELQQRGLAAAARPQDDHGLAVGDPQRQVVDGERRALPAARHRVVQRLADADQVDPRHAPSLSRLTFRVR